MGMKIRRCVASRPVGGDNNKFQCNVQSSLPGTKNILLLLMFLFIKCPRSFCGPVVEHLNELSDAICSCLLTEVCLS